MGVGVILVQLTDHFGGERRQHQLPYGYPDQQSVETCRILHKTNSQEPTRKQVIGS
jgi:hypothetical protein